MIRAVIFDFNGVLVDDEHAHCQFLREVLAEEGAELTQGQYYGEYLGYDDRGCFEIALRKAGQECGPVRVESLIARKAERYSAWAANSLVAFPGSAEVVNRLATQWPLAICSGALRGEIASALQSLGIFDCFKGGIISAEDTDRCKPDPEGYLLALDALRASCDGTLEAAHCLVIEDSLAGVQSGKAAGMWVMGVTHTYPAEQLRAAGADTVVTSLEAVSPLSVLSLFRPEVSP